MMSLDQRDQPNLCCQSFVSDKRRHWADEESGAPKHTLKVASQGQGQSDAVAVQLFVDASPRRNEDNRLRRVAPRGLQNTVYILARVRFSGRVVGVVLSANFDAHVLENGLELVIDPR